MSLALGKIEFSDTPTVASSPVLTEASLPGQLTNLVVPGTEGFTMPNGTTAQRPGAPLVGEQRWNTTDGNPEVWSGSAWLPYARTVQSVSGTIGNTSGTTGKTTATVPTIAEGIQIWTRSFTPLVAGSSITIQYTITAYSVTAGRLVFTSVFAGSTCIGMTGAWNATAAGTLATGAGMTQLAMQCVYANPGTSAITFSARCGAYAASAPGNVGVNQLANGNTFGSSMVTEYRIVETI